MKTEFIKQSEICDSVFIRAGEIIREGGLVAFPTETVYGLGGNAYDNNASSKIFKAKGRPSDNPLIVHISMPEDAEKFAYTDSTYFSLAQRFMPGALTVVLKKKEIIPDSVTGGLDSVAVRCPEHSVARKLISYAGVPIAAPSANISGAPSPTTADHVFNDMNGKIDMIIDGGECRIGVESTVITYENSICTVLRPGEIIPRELCGIFSDVYVADAVCNPSAAGDKPLSPGMKYKHYAPKSPLYLVDATSDSFKKYVCGLKGKIAVLSYSEYINDYNTPYVYDCGAESNPSEQMHRLFTVLRNTDNTSFDAIYAHLPPKTDEYLALYNRIIRAAGCEIIKLD